MPSFSHQDMLRVAVDGLGYIGIVKITNQTTLAGLRSLLASTFDADTIPPYYAFVDACNRALNKQAEATNMAWDCRPVIRIVPTEKPPGQVPVDVELWTGDTFRMWATESCSFKQLRNEASKYWRFDPSETILADEKLQQWDDTDSIYTYLQFSYLSTTPGGLKSTPTVSQPRFILHLRNHSLHSPVVVFDRNQQVYSPISRQQSGNNNGLDSTSRPRISTFSPESPVRSHSGHDSNSDSDFLSSDFDSDEDSHDSASTFSASTASGHPRGRSTLHSYSDSGSDLSDFSDDGDFDSDRDDHQNDQLHQQNRRTPSRNRNARSRSRSHADANTRNGFSTLYQPIPDEVVPIRCEALSSFLPYCASNVFLASADHSLAMVQELAQLEPHLWHIFTWYCAAGDASDIHRMRLRQFRCFLDDAGLLRPDEPGIAAVASSPAPYHLDHTRWADPDAPPLLSPQQADLLYSAAVGHAKSAHTRRLENERQEALLSLPSHRALTERLPRFSPARLRIHAAVSGSSGAGGAAGGTVSSLSTGDASSSVPAVLSSGLDYLHFLQILMALALRRVHPTGTQHPPSYFLPDTACVLPTVISSETGVAALTSLLSDGLKQSLVEHYPPIPYQVPPGGVLLHDTALAAVLSFLRAMLAHPVRHWVISEWKQESFLLRCSRREVQGVFKEPVATQAVDSSGEPTAFTVLSVFQPYAPALRLLFEHYAALPQADIAYKLPPLSAFVDRKTLEACLHATNSATALSDIATGLTRLKHHPELTAYVEEDQVLDSENEEDDNLKRRTSVLHQTMQQRKQVKLENLNVLMNVLRTQQVNSRSRNNILLSENSIVSQNSTSLSDSWTPTEVPMHALPTDAAAEGSSRTKYGSTARKLFTDAVQRSMTSAPSNTASATSAATQPPPVPSAFGGAAPKIRNPSVASPRMCLSALLRLLLDLGLTSGKKAYVPLRLVTEAFLASALSAGADVPLDAADHEEATGSSSFAAHPSEPRVALTFSQFLDCLGRLTLRMSRKVIENAITKVHGASNQLIQLYLGTGNISAYACIKIFSPFLASQAFLSVMNQALSGPKFMDTALKHEREKEGDVRKLMQMITQFNKIMVEHHVLSRKAFIKVPDYVALLSSIALASARQWNQVLVSIDNQKVLLRGTNFSPTLPDFDSSNFRHDGSRTAHSAASAPSATTSSRKLSHTHTLSRIEQSATVPTFTSPTRSPTLSPAHGHTASLGHSVYAYRKHPHTHGFSRIDLPLTAQSQDMVPKLPPVGGRVFTNPTLQHHLNRHRAKHADDVHESETASDATFSESDSDSQAERRRRKARKGQGPSRSVSAASALVRSSKSVRSQRAIDSPPDSIAQLREAEKEWSRQRAQNLELQRTIQHHQQAMRLLAQQKDAEKEIEKQRRRQEFEQNRRRNVDSEPLAMTAFLRSKSAGLPYDRVDPYSAPSFDDNGMPVPHHSPLLSSLQGVYSDNANRQRLRELYLSSRSHPAYHSPPPQGMGVASPPGVAGAEGALTTSPLPAEYSASALPSADLPSAEHYPSQYDPYRTTSPLPFGHPDIHADVHVNIPLDSRTTVPISDRPNAPYYIGLATHTHSPPSPYIANGIASNVSVPDAVIPPLVQPPMEMEKASVAELVPITTVVAMEETAHAIAPTVPDIAPEPESTGPQPQPQPRGRSAEKMSALAPQRVQFGKQRGKSAVVEKRVPLPSPLKAAAINETSSAASKPSQPQQSLSPSIVPSESRDRTSPPPPSSDTQSIPTATTTAATTTSSSDASAQTMPATTSQPPLTADPTTPHAASPLLAPSATASPIPHGIGSGASIPTNAAPPSRVPNLPPPHPHSASAGSPSFVVSAASPVQRHHAHEGVQGPLLHAESPQPVSSTNTAIAAAEEGFSVYNQAVSSSTAASTPKSQASHSHNPLGFEPTTRNSSRNSIDHSASNAAGRAVGVVNMGVVMQVGAGENPRGLRKNLSALELVKHQLQQHLLTTTESDASSIPRALSSASLVTDIEAYDSPTGANANNGMKDDIEVDADAVVAGALDSDVVEDVEGHLMEKDFPSTDETSELLSSNLDTSESKSLLKEEQAAPQTAPQAADHEDDEDNLDDIESDEDSADEARPALATAAAQLSALVTAGSDSRKHGLVLTTAPGLDAPGGFTSAFETPLEDIPSELEATPPQKSSRPIALFRSPSPRPPSVSPPVTPATPLATPLATDGGTSGGILSGGIAMTPTMGAVAHLHSHQPSDLLSTPGTPDTPNTPSSTFLTDAESEPRIRTVPPAETPASPSGSPYSTHTPRSPRAAGAAPKSPASPSLRPSLFINTPGNGTTAGSSGMGSAPAPGEGTGVVALPSRLGRPPIPTPIGGHKDMEHNGHNTNSSAPGTARPVSASHGPQSSRQASSHRDSFDSTFEARISSYPSVGSVAGFEDSKDLADYESRRDQLERDWEMYTASLEGSDDEHSGTGKGSRVVRDLPSKLDSGRDSVHTFDPLRDLPRDRTKDTARPVLQKRYSSASAGPDSVAGHSSSSRRRSSASVRTLERDREREKVLERVMSQRNSVISGPDGFAAPPSPPTADIPVVVALAQRPRLLSEAGPPPDVSSAIALLQMGEVFVKYGRSGFPHKRLVYLSADMLTFRWRKVNSKPKDEGKDKKEYIHLPSIYKISTDLSSLVFQKNAKKVSDSKSCFTLHTKLRTLDIEAETEYIKDKWIKAIELLRKYVR